jgi:hypothetical protein
MPLVVPNEGEVRLLTDLLGGGTLANWTLRLYKTNTTPAETDTYAAPPGTECDFTNYAARTLTRSVSGTTWAAPASGAPTGGWSAEAAVAESTYGGGTPQSWTCGATGNTVYGYWLRDETNLKLIGAELFATPRTLASGDTLNVTPRIGLA